MVSLQQLVPNFLFRLKTLKKEQLNFTSIMGNLCSFPGAFNIYFLTGKTKQTNIFGHQKLVELCMKLTMVLLLFKLTQERLETQLTSKQKGVKFGSTEPRKDICLELNVVLFLRITDLLLTEFEGSTTSYEAFRFNLWPKCKA